MQNIQQDQNAALLNKLAQQMLTQQISDKDKSESMEVIRWLCFMIGEHAYAVEVINVQEVVIVPDISPVAGTPREYIGVMNLRGQIVPVIDLRVQLAMDPSQDSPQRRIVVLEQQGEQLGLLVDMVAEVFTAPINALEKYALVPNALPIEWFYGVLRHEEQLVIALHARKLLHI